MITEILQLTDLHLMCDPQERLKGVPTRDSLQEVLGFIRTEEESGRWNFETITITGDLAHDEQLPTYELLRGILGDWLPRCRLIPGNHDNRSAIRQVFPELVIDDSCYACFSVKTGDWQLIGLDSHLPGEVAGQLDAEQLDWLADELQKHSSRPTILFVHHPPFSVRSEWLDRINLQNADQLNGLVQANSQVRVICTGHVHHEFKDHFGQVDLLTTPSTGVQFQPYQETPVYEAIPPGFRIFRLDHDSYQTEVVRLPELKFPPQPADS